MRRWTISELVIDSRVQCFPSTVSVTGCGVAASDTFKTPSVKLDSWTRCHLTFFFKSEPESRLNTTAGHNWPELRSTGPNSPNSWGPSPLRPNETSSTRVQWSLWRWKTDSGFSRCLLLAFHMFSIIIVANLSLILSLTYCHDIRCRKGVPVVCDWEEAQNIKAENGRRWDWE